jgi:hypothetical protein
MVGRRSKKKTMKKKKQEEEEVQKQDYDDNKSTSTESTSSELTEKTPIVEKLSRKQRKAERKKRTQSPSTIWSNLNMMCDGCCGAMTIIEPAEAEEEDLFADEDNILSKIGHSIMHRAGLAPPVKIIRCTQLDDDSVITTPKVLVELAKQYDEEKFFVKGGTMPNDTSDGTVVTTRSNLSSLTSRSRRLLPSLSGMSTGKSFRSTKSRSGSVRSSSRGGSTKEKTIKNPVKVSEGRFEI